jgi:cytochrome b subunit of formate dehydrogenase
MDRVIPAEPDLTPFSPVESDVYYLRITLNNRILHFLIVSSFLGLVLTGMPIKFSHSPVVVTLAPYFGGIVMARFLHRFFAIITFFYFAVHLIHVFHRHFFKKERGLFWGANSMVPHPNDLKNLMAHFRWFLHLGPRPKFGRFTYWEKFDYWAVFWGVGMIGTSGLFLWFPTLFAKYFPGWIFNVAVIIHSDEALLAAGFIFIVHFFNTHLRPTKFPLDDVIITGRISREEMLYEHPLEYEYLQEKGLLERRRIDPPPLWMRNVSKVIGFSAMGLGITTIFFILWALAQNIYILLILFRIAFPLIAIATVLYVVFTSEKWKSLLGRRWGKEDCPKDASSAANKDSLRNRENQVKMR